VRVNIGPVYGEAVHEQAAYNRVPQGRGLALINPRTGEVSRLSQSAEYNINATWATQTRVGRGQSIIRTRGG